MIHCGEDSLEPRILFEDGSLIAVFKPPRMHSAPGAGEGDLCSWAFERYPEARQAGASVTGRSPEEGGLLHRLDYETSGIVLFARNSEAFGSLLRQQDAGLFHKEYIALSSIARHAFPEGSVPRAGFPSGIDEEAWSTARQNLDAVSIAALLGGEAGDDSRTVRCSFRAFGPKGARVACVGPLARKNGRPGPIYISEILGCSALSSRLELRIGLSRGFRHQVRAQLAWIGLPISGDSLYGGAPDGRLCLYAVGLEFAHPVTGEAVRLSAEDPPLPARERRRCF